MNRLELLDYGRFFAASIVVLFHYTFNGIANGKIDSMDHVPSLIEATKYGYLGVEFFFIISGYVIFFSAKNRTPSRFAVSRALRLYPAFWVAVCFTASITVLWGAPHFYVTLPQVLVNMTMVSRLMGVPYVDGVYWTLYFELTFYFGIFVLMLLGQQKRLTNIMIAWPFVMLAATFSSVSHLPFLGGYYAYFAAGTLFAIASSQKTPAVLASLLTAYGLCVSYSGGLAESFGASKGTTYSALVISGIVTTFFLFFAYLNTERGQSLRLPKSRLLGGLTYPLYLIHAHVGYIVLTRFASNEARWVSYTAAIGFVLLVAYGIHVVVEQRMAPLWKALFENTVGRFARLLEGIVPRGGNASH